jgi:hypothetical protein
MIFCFLTFSDASVQSIFFTAYLTSTLRNYQEVLKPYTVINDVGGCFDNSSGIFQASVAGVYLFVGTAQSYSDGYTSFILVKESHDVSYAWPMAYGEHTTLGTVHATLNLSVGEKVWLRSDRSNTYYDSRATAFTGVLIHADV